MIKMARFVQVAIGALLVMFTAVASNDGDLVSGEARRYIESRFALFLERLHRSGSTHRNAIRRFVRILVRHGRLTTELADVHAVTTLLYSVGIRTIAQQQLAAMIQQEMVSSPKELPVLLKINVTVPEVVRPYAEALLGGLPLEDGGQVDGKRVAMSMGVHFRQDRDQDDDQLRWKFEMLLLERVLLGKGFKWSLLYGAAVAFLTWILVGLYFNRYSAPALFQSENVTESTTIQIGSSSGVNSVLGADWWVLFWIIIPLVVVIVAGLLLWWWFAGAGAEPSHAKPSDRSVKGTLKRASSAAPSSPSESTTSLTTSRRGSSSLSKKVLAR